jgi:hypothetical protein
MERNWGVLRKQRKSHLSTRECWSPAEQMREVFQEEDSFVTLSL